VRSHILTTGGEAVISLLGMFAEYLKAIELDPKNWEFHNSLAVNYSEANGVGQFG
jgi:Tetratricopeptide repeat